jgi:hypothetical protein
MLLQRRTAAPRQVLQAIRPVRGEYASGPVTDMVDMMVHSKIITFTQRQEVLIKIAGSFNVTLEVVNQIHMNVSMISLSKLILMNPASLFISIHPSQYNTPCPAGF